MTDQGLGGVHLEVLGVGEHLLDGLDLCNVTNKGAARTGGAGAGEAGYEHACMHSQQQQQL